LSWKISRWLHEAGIEQRRKNDRDYQKLQLAAGLPICELQACGSLIFTPRPEWAGAHWIKPDVRLAGPGFHSGNFVVYENTVEALVTELHAARALFNPAGVVKTFARSHPQLLGGNAHALADFLGMVSDGTIHSGLHVQHATVGR